MATCIIDGCEKPVRARGWCRTHYARWYHHGNISVTSAINASKAEASMCMVRGCDKTALYRAGRSHRGYCRAHRGMAVPQAPSLVRGHDWYADRLVNLDATESALLDEKD